MAGRVRSPLKLLDALSICNGSPAQGLFLGLKHAGGDNWRRQLASHLFATETVFFADVMNFESCILLENLFLVSSYHCIADEIDRPVANTYSHALPLSQQRPWG